MKRLILLVLLAAVAVPLCAATFLPVRAGSTGVCVGFDGTVAFSACGLILPSASPVNGGFRAVSTISGQGTIYPLMIRARVAMFAIEGGIGYDWPSDSPAVYVMPSFSLSFGVIGLMAGIPLSWSGKGFGASFEISLTLR